MAWKVSGQSLELCSCKMLCPCWLGPEFEADRGWCAGGFAFDVREGDSDGVDLGGTKAFLMAEWPGNFFLGGGKARIYVDESASAEQQRELEAIFSGHKGGHLEGLFAAAVASWLPAKPAKIDIQWGDSPSVTVGEFGKATLAPIKNPMGQPTRVEGAMAQAGFNIDGMELASSKGSRFSDPDMRAWDGDSGTLHKFNWSA